MRYCLNYEAFQVIYPTLLCWFYCRNQCNGYTYFHIFSLQNSFSDKHLNKFFSLWCSVNDNLNFSIVGLLCYLGKQLLFFLRNLNQIHNSLPIWRSPQNKLHRFININGLITRNPQFWKSTGWKAQMILQKGFWFV